VDKPNFFDVKVFGNQAEMLSQHLGKGRRIGVDGRLDWSSWESQDGGKRSKVEVIAQSVQFLDSRTDGEGGGGGSFVPAGAAQSSSADFPSSPTDDDIPF
jgi:single-strand DNA-binding protein